MAKVKDPNVYVNDLEHTLLESIDQMSDTYVEYARNYGDALNKLLQTPEIKDLLGKKSQAMALKDVQEILFKELEKKYPNYVAGNIPVKCKDGKIRNYNAEAFTWMITRTATRDTREAAFQNEMLDAGLDLVIVSVGGSGDACSNWEGQVLSISGQTPGYPTVEEAKATGEIFHPNCVHTTSPYLLYEREGKVGVLGRDIPEEEIQLGKFGVEATGPSPKTREMMDWLEEQIRVNNWDKKQARTMLAAQYNLPKYYHTIDKVLKEVFARVAVTGPTVTPVVPTPATEALKPVTGETEFERLNSDIRSYKDQPTIQQAGGWAIAGNIPVSYVDYTKLDLEFANLVNQEMYAHTRLWGRLGITAPEISISVNTKRNSDASMYYMPSDHRPLRLEFNRVYNMKKAAGRDSALKVTFKFRANHWVIDTKLSDGPNLNAKAMVDHELGHYLENTIWYRGDPKGWGKMWRKLYKEHSVMISNDISAYAAKKEEEGFAEAYAWYVNKNKASVELADWAVKFFDSVFANKNLTGEKLW